ncbi:MAG: VOC family protein [Anaerolineales bacterium]|nr:VOC family protein [Anaerolineales bacterium]
MHLSAIWFPVSDWERAKAFYGQALGLPLRQLNDADGWAAYATGGAPLFIVRRPGLPANPGGPVVTFASDDLEALRDRLETAGARVNNDLAHSGDLLIMTFYDPDGHRLEAAQVLARE